MKKKVFLFAYTQTNLGDDLFVELMLKKYPEIDFEIFIPDFTNTRAFNKYENIKIFEKNDRNLSLVNPTNYDAIAFVSGSIFMENVGAGFKLMKEYENFIKQCNKKQVPFYYISSNFGPYTTEKFLQSARETFKNCNGVCFRDKYSYNLFKDINTVSYAPDLIFLYPIYKNVVKDNTVGITVIDLSIRKDLKEYEVKYYYILKNNILNYIENGKEVYLFSFCNLEGDKKAIYELLKIIPKEKQKYIHIIEYDGDTEKFLKIYSSMEYMICTRFHATVLSTLLLQKSYHLTYSNKTINIIEDLKLNFNHESIKNLEDNYLITFDMFKCEAKDKIDNIKQKANNQLKEFNKIINN